MRPCRDQRPPLLPLAAHAPRALARRARDRFELGAARVFAALSLWVLALDLYRCRARPRLDRDRRLLPRRPDAVPGVDRERARTTCWPRTCSCCAPRRPTTSSRRSPSRAGWSRSACRPGWRCCRGSRSRSWPRSSPSAPTRTAASPGLGAPGGARARAVLRLFTSSTVASSATCSSVSVLGLSVRAARARRR